MKLFRRKEGNNTLEALADLRRWLVASSDSLSRRKNAYELKLREEQRLVRRLEKMVDLTADDDIKEELRRIELLNHQKIVEEYLQRYKAVSLELVKVKSSLSLLDLIKEDLRTRATAERINYREKILEIKNKIGEGGIVGEPIESVHEALRDLVEEIKAKIPADILKIEEILGEERKKEGGRGVDVQ
mgnify:CR=1 FL=1